MASEPETVDAELAEQEPMLPATVEAERPLVELFPRDPVEALVQMQALVSMMHGAIKASGERKFIAHIQGRPYPQVTWWTTIGLPLQLLPQIRWCHRIDTEENSGYAAETWQSRCEVVHTPSGNIVASGEGLCCGGETNNDGTARWTDSHAIMAMSQTRAIGRTFRQCLAGLAVMAGLEATPAEEMNDKMTRGSAAPPPQRATQASPGGANGRQGAPRDTGASKHPFAGKEGTTHEGAVAGIQDEADWRDGKGGRREKCYMLHDLYVLWFTESNPASEKANAQWGVSAVVRQEIVRVWFMKKAAIAEKYGITLSERWPPAVPCVASAHVRPVTDAPLPSDDDFMPPDEAEPPAPDTGPADAVRGHLTEWNTMLTNTGAGDHFTLACKKHKVANWLTEPDAGKLGQVLSTLVATHPPLPGGEESPDF